MKKTEIKRRAQKLINSFNACTIKRCEFGGFHTTNDGTEYLLVKSNFDFVYYGFLQRFEEETTLKFFAVNAVGNNNLHFLFFRGQCMKINEKIDE